MKKYELTLHQADDLDKQIAKDLQDIQDNGDGFDDLPADTYVVKCTGMELGETKETAKPMIKMEFTIQEGKYINRKMWINTVLLKKDGSTNGFGIKIALDILKSMKTNVDLTWESRDKLRTDLLDVYEYINNKSPRVFALELKYTTSKDGNTYSNYKIKEVYAE